MSKASFRVLSVAWGGCKVTIVTVMAGCVNIGGVLLMSILPHAVSDVWQRNAGDCGRGSTAGW